MKTKVIRLSVCEETDGKEDMVNICRVPTVAEPTAEELDGVIQVMRVMPHFALAALAGGAIKVMAERETAKNPEVLSGHTVHAEVE